MIILLFSKTGLGKTGTRIFERETYIRVNSGENRTQLQINDVNQVRRAANLYLYSIIWLINDAVDGRSKTYTVSIDKTSCFINCNAMYLSSLHYKHIPLLLLWLLNLVCLLCAAHDNVCDFVLSIEDSCKLRSFTLCVVSEVSLVLSHCYFLHAVRYLFFISW